MGASWSNKWTELCELGRLKIKANGKGVFDVCWKAGREGEFRKVLVTRFTPAGEKWQVDWEKERRKKRVVFQCLRNSWTRAVRSLDDRDRDSDSRADVGKHSLHNWLLNETVRVRLTG